MGWRRDACAPLTLARMTALAWEMSNADGETFFFSGNTSVGCCSDLLLMGLGQFSRWVLMAGGERLVFCFPWGGVRWGSPRSLALSCFVVSSVCPFVPRFHRNNKRDFRESDDSEDSTGDVKAAVGGEGAWSPLTSVGQGGVGVVKKEELMAHMISD